MAHVSRRLKEVAMKDIPEITSDIIARLKELHIDSVSQLAVQIPMELALKLKDDDMNVEAVNRLIANARKVLTDCKILSKEFLTVDDL